MEEQFVKLIAQISVYIIILPTVAAIIRWRSANREQRLLSYLIFSSLLVEFAAFGISTLGGGNNLFLLHIFTLIEFTLLVLIFQPHIEDSIGKKTVYYLIAAFLSYSVLNSIFIEPLTQFNAMARAVEGLLIISIDLLCLYLILQKLNVKFPASAPIIWISLGTLIYFSGSLFIFIFSNYVLSSQTVSVTIWGLHAFMSIVLNLFYTVALWVRPKG